MLSPLVPRKEVSAACIPHPGAWPRSSWCLQQHTSGSSSDSKSNCAYREKPCMLEEELCHSSLAHYSLGWRGSSQGNLCYWALFIFSWYAALVPVAPHLQGWLQELPGHRVKPKASCSVLTSLLEAWMNSLKMWIPIFHAEQPWILELNSSPARGRLQSSSLLFESQMEAAFSPIQPLCPMERWQGHRRTLHTGVTAVLYTQAINRHSRAQGPTLSALQAPLVFGSSLPTGLTMQWLFPRCSQPMPILAPLLGIIIIGIIIMHLLA